MRTVVFALTLAVLADASVARGQSAIVELTQSVGGSSDELAAAAAQVHAFGEFSSGLRFNAEVAWGARSSDEGDFFGTAYPYDNQLRVIEAYVERTFRPGGALFGIRGGRYRTPFGISAGSDHAYIGFLRPPLIRYDDYFALSNDFLEHGIDVVVGRPRLSVEVSAGVPADVGEARRRQGFDAVVRGQGYWGPLIVGASYIRTLPYQSPRFAHGHARFGGIDVRWMREGVQVRGEWLAGRPFDGTRTDGGYADLIVHRPGMGPVTALVRVERMFYDAVPPFALRAERLTAGARVRLLGNLALSVGVLRHFSDQPAGQRRTALDAGLTYAIRRD